MLAMEERQSAVANNIANASTVGFKSHNPVQLGFYEIFSAKLRQPSYFNGQAAPAGGVKIVETHTDLSAGIFQVTDNPLSLALQGPGYFVIDTEHGERFTRGGNFTLDSEGNLVTPNGSMVQTTDGQRMDLRGGEVNVDADGLVSVDGVLAGVVRVVEFEDPRRLERMGENIYSASEAVRGTMIAASGTSVAQNVLESSNVSVPHEMVRMMMGTRAYEANQRAIQSIDTTIGRLIDQVGMP